MLFKIQGGGIFCLLIIIFAMSFHLLLKQLTVWHDTGITGQSDDIY